MICVGYSLLDHNMKWLKWNQFRWNQWYHTRDIQESDFVTVYSAKLLRINKNQLKESKTTK